MESFDVTDISNALKEVTGEKINKNVEATNLAREKGWVLPEQYDYTKYNSGSAEKPEEVTEQSEIPEWAAKAAKYEWNDEFGDVGPPNKELEDMLFRNEFINRAGLKIGKYVDIFMNQ